MHLTLKEREGIYISGGYFDYNQYKIDDIAEKLEHVIRGAIERKDSPLEDYSCEHGLSWAKSFLAECSPETLREFENGLLTLKQAAVYAQRIDWLLSGDDGEETFHQRLKKDLNEI